MKKQKSYKIIKRYCVELGRHLVHNYLIEYEDGTREQIPGFLALALHDEDEPCIYCGRKPRCMITNLCDSCERLEDDK